MVETEKGSMFYKDFADLKGLEVYLKRSLYIPKSSRFSEEFGPIRKTLEMNGFVVVSIIDEDNIPRVVRIIHENGRYKLIQEEIRL